MRRTEQEENEIMLRYESSRIDPPDEDCSGVVEDEIYFLEELAFVNVEGYSYHNSLKKNVEAVKKAYNEYMIHGKLYDDCSMSESFIYHLGDLGLDIKELSEYLEEGEEELFIGNIETEAYLYAKERN